MSRLSEILAEEERVWRDLCSRFERLSADDWTRPGLNGDWTPKDLLAHIACWHAEAETMLEVFRARGDEPVWVDTDAFNADAYDRCREMTLREVQAMSGAAHHRYREECARLAEPLGEAIEGVVELNGHRHYADHFAGFDAFLGRVRT